MTNAQVALLAAVDSYSDGANEYATLQRASNFLNWLNSQHQSK